MNDIAAFRLALGDVPSFTEGEVVRRKSRDMTANFSPVLARDAMEHVAEVLVRPRTKMDVVRIAAAAVRTRVPPVVRVAGTANFGQGIPLRGGAMVDMTGLGQVLWVRDGRVRAEAGARLGAIDEAARPRGLRAAHALLERQDRLRDRCASQVRHRRDGRDEGARHRRDVGGALEALL